VAQRVSRRTVLPCLCICLPPLCLSVECVYPRHACGLAVPYPPTQAAYDRTTLRSESREPPCHREAAAGTNRVGQPRSGLGSTVGRVHRTSNRGGDCLPTEGRQPGSDQLAEWGVGTLQDGKARPEGITA
jgi:hypothetical protein